MIIPWLTLAIILPSPWGIPTVGTPQHFAESFRPTGEYAQAYWSLRKTKVGSILEYNCQVRKGCVSHPSQARFYFSGTGQLASAELSFKKERGPDETSISSEILRHLGPIGRPVVDTLQLDRRIQYLLRRPHIRLVPDGPDADLTLYVDQ